MNAVERTPDINIEYYAQRAEEYDITASYQDSNLAARVAPMKARYQLAFEGRDVLEIACGTGYWTQVVAVSARSILATDVNREVIEVARRRVGSEPNVRFQQADAYSLDGVEGLFSGAFAQFWWSHVPRKRLPAFLGAVQRRLLPGSPVLFMDALLHRYPGGRRLDANGDVIEERLLLDGRRYEIIKNFPIEEEVRETLADFGDEVVFKAYPATGSWTVSYKTRRGS